MNYNTVEEIFSVNITNMEIIRDNINQDDGTDTITGVSWFSFNGVNASNIYVNGNSWIGFGSHTEHLKVNNRDGALYSLYREEGTLYNYYKFLKIKWKGYSHYSRTESSYALEYDVILWDTGDISLHMISIPTQYNTGIYSLVASSTYSYIVSDTSPDVTFIKTDTGFEVSNEIINLKPPYEERYLIRSGSTYYTVINNSLSEIANANISSSTFLNYGVEEIPNISLLTNLSNPEILYWVENEAYPINNLRIKGTPPLPQISYYPSQNITNGSKIEIMEVNASDDTLFTITFNNGSTWYYYDIATKAWVIANSETVGMTKSTLKSITKDMWSQIASSTTYQLRYVLPSIESYAGKVGVNYA